MPSLLSRRQRFNRRDASRWCSRIHGTAPDLCRTCQTCTGHCKRLSCFLVHSNLTKSSAVVEKTVPVAALCFFFPRCLLMSSKSYLHFTEAPSKPNRSTSLAQASPRGAGAGGQPCPSAGAALSARRGINSCWHTQPSKSCMLLQ